MLHDYNRQFLFIRLNTLANGDLGPNDGDGDGGGLLAHQAILASALVLVLWKGTE